MHSVYFPINSTSLGASGYHIFRHLPDDVALFPIGDNIDGGSFEPVGNDVKLKIGTALERGMTSHDVRSTSLKLWHPFAGIVRVSQEQILYTFHELDSLTKTELNSLNQQKAIIVPSEFVKNVFVQCGVKPPVSVVPLGVDKNVFKPLEKYKNKAGPFVFLMAGKFEARKLHFEILEAFNLTFRDNPNVRLRCAISNRFCDMQTVYNTILHGIFRGKMPSNVEFVEWMPTESHFADFLNSGDCLIAPSRGESFNLPLLQAMACGIQVITNCDHAHADYVNDKNSILCKSDGKITAFDKLFFKNDGKTNTGNWFSVNTNSLAQAIITVFQNGRHLNLEGISTAENYSWQNTADGILKIWDSLQI